MVKKAAIGLIAIVALMLTACNYNAPPYPDFSDPNTVISQAQTLSDNLTSYIHQWAGGTASATLPANLLPVGASSLITNYQLQTPAQADPTKYWGVRQSQPINWSSDLASFPDPHVTYIVMPAFYAPFGSKLIVQGQFPHSRFFDIQVTPSFSPYTYRYNGSVGVGEVPIVDQDIAPDAGSVNPFLPGANRSATNRNFTVTYNMTMGNGVTQNPNAFNRPYYEDNGTQAGTTGVNVRNGGAIEYQGPWGTPAYKSPGNGTGEWDTGSIWIRYYGPDNAAGPMGGVPLPKVYCQLADGTQFLITNDFSQWAAQSEARTAVTSTTPADPPSNLGPSVGWVKEMGIFRTIVEGIVPQYLWYETPAQQNAYIRNLDLGVAGRGESVAPPGNFAPSATSCSYINYMVRGMALNTGKVIVITGKLPTTPNTRGGAATMSTAQARYLSITSYADQGSAYGLVISSLMDDEIVTDSNGNYVIVYSQPADRPANATAANGVTWVNWGPPATQSWTIRWMSVHDDTGHGGWDFAQTPSEDHVGWNADPASTIYNPAVIGQNNQNGFLGGYQPIIHYMTTAQFAALGAPVNPNTVPVWH